MNKTKYPTVDQVIARLSHPAMWPRNFTHEIIMVAIDLYLEQPADESIERREAPAEVERIDWAAHPWAKWAALYNSETIIMAEYEIFLDGRVWKWVNETGRAEFVDIPKQKPDFAASLRARPENV